MRAQTRRRNGLVAALVGCSLAITACGAPPGTAPAPDGTATNTPTRGSSTGPGPGSPGGSAGSSSTAGSAPATSGGGSPGPSASSRASGVPTPTPAAAQCADLAASLSLRNQVGQLMMVAVPSTGVGSAAAAAVADSRAGAVILLGNSTAGAASISRVVEQAHDAARTPKGIQALLAADQEGGQVQRLQGRGFDRIPSAQQQAQDSPSELTNAAARWGRQLKRAGIDANLAPVADVVPQDLRRVNQPIGVLQRGYGSDPAKVAAHVAAFVQGMADAGVATSVKHFPGLGRVRGNTDLTARVVDRTTTRNDPDLEPFAAGVGAGTDMVMMSSAYYTKIDAKRRAAFSPTVITGMVRGDLGFTGVIISDDLAAAAMQDLAPGERMLRFLRAGGDLAIVGDPSMAVAMADAVVQEAGDDDELAADIETATVRVLQLKDRRGLASC